MGKAALVTGGSRGIGRAISNLLLEFGCQVTVTARTEESLLSFIQTVPASWRERLDTIVCDFNLDEQVRELEQCLGNKPTDILINCAGVNKIGLLEDISFNEFSEIQRVNVEGPFRLCKAAVVGMAARDWGRIVNVTSIFGSVSKAHRLSYSTSKFALHGMTKSLALDYAERGVLVNAVAPGVIETTLTRNVLGDDGVKKILASIPVGRLGKPEEIAKMIVFLASEANSYVTGQQIIVDGGYTSA